MSRSRRSTRKKPEKKNSSKSIVYIIILIAALAAIGFLFLGEFTFRNDFNSVVNELDDGFSNNDEKLVKECMLKLEDLKKANMDKQERLDPINENLLKCYRRLSLNPGISHKERLVYLKKIYAIAPDSLSELDRKLVE